MGTEHYTTRFGRVVLAPGVFTHIRASHVLEHVPNLVQTMTSCLNLLRDGGEMSIEVPYDLSFGAWQDPTHIRAFNERSWLYYTTWHWMIGWNEWRFDQIQNALMLSTFGQELKKQGMADEAIRRTPRAVDTNLAVLRKRRLTEQEIQQGRQFAQPRAVQLAKPGVAIAPAPIARPSPEGPESVASASIRE